MNVVLLTSRYGMDEDAAALFRFTSRRLELRINFALPSQDEELAGDDTRRNSFNEAKCPQHSPRLIP